MATNIITYGQLIGKMKELGTIKKAVGWLVEQYDANLYSCNTIRTTGHRILNEFKL